jgi:predicted nucleic acid-binding protein
LRVVFADANYLAALLNPKEELHRDAKRISEELGSCRVVTSEFVLLEVMRLLAGQ